MEKLYDLIIIGGGPAGCAAAVYASRKCLSFALITEDIGGQSIVSEDIQNWIGTPHIKGSELADALKAHVLEYKNEGSDLVLGDTVTDVQKQHDGTFHITTKKGVTYHARTILVTSGASRRRLSIPGADRFEHKGVTYCASCDGPLFTGQDVAVIGGGNAGFETASQLLAYAKSVTLFHKNAEFKADPVTVARLLKDPKMTAITNAELLEITGENFVSGLRYRTPEGEKEIALQGIFVEIGSVPSISFLKDCVDLTPHKHIVVNPKNQQTSCVGIWAAGDATDGLYHQNNIAMGDAVKALEDIYLFIKAR